MFQYEFEYSGNFQFMNNIHRGRMWTMRNTTDVCCGSFSKRVGRKNAMKRKRCGRFRTSIVKSDAATLGCWRVFYDSSSLTHCSVSIVDCFLCSTNRRTTGFFSKKPLAAYAYAHRIHTYSMHVCMSVYTHLHFRRVVPWLWYSFGTCNLK